MNIIKHAIKNNMRIPDSSILFYPCVRILYDNFCPSMLIALEECLIDYMMIYNLAHTVLDLVNNKIEDYANDDTLNILITDPKVKILIIISLYCY